MDVQIAPLLPLGISSSNTHQVKLDLYTLLLDYVHQISYSPTILVPHQVVSISHDAVTHKLEAYLLASFPCPLKEKRAWYTLPTHASKCTENPGTSHIAAINYSANYVYMITSSYWIHCWIAEQVYCRKVSQSPGRKASYEIEAYFCLVLNIKSPCARLWFMNSCTEILLIV